MSEDTNAEPDIFVDALDRLILKVLCHAYNLEPPTDESIEAAIKDARSLPEDPERLKRIRERVLMDLDERRYAQEHNELDGNPHSNI